MYDKEPQKVCGKWTQNSFALLGIVAKIIIFVGHFSFISFLVQAGQLYRTVDLCGRLYCFSGFEVTIKSRLS
ncbi:hypothetical protein PORY_002348 [Pneumocystis oryctolagi]|uniref:Uncharacterized protein n=1 Tax=Pneumocystis oryctolagi TaxID=42067 RepID=A0ACB7CCE7_9ASCO|nr:hypothetical protein PORY_002348 [Pneumocystis oryctolagi]